MDELALYVGVFLGAAVPFLEVWIAVPLGVIAGLPWVPAAIVGFVGNFVSLLPIIYATEKLKKLGGRWLKRPPKKEENLGSYKRDRKQKIMSKFGIPGLAFLGPFLIGVHAAASFSIAMGASRNKVLFWFTVSLLLCSFVFGYLASVGYTEVTDGKQLPF